MNKYIKYIKYGSIFLLIIAIAIIVSIIFNRDNFANTAENFSSTAEVSVLPSLDIKQPPPNYKYCIFIDRSTGDLNTFDFTDFINTIKIAFNNVRSNNTNKIGSIKSRLSTIESDIRTLNINTIKNNDNFYLNVLGYDKYDNGSREFVEMENSGVTLEGQDNSEWHRIKVTDTPSRARFKVEKT